MLNFILCILLFPTLVPKFPASPLLQWHIILYYIWESYPWFPGSHGQLIRTRQELISQVYTVSSSSYVTNIVKLMGTLSPSIKSSSPLYKETNSQNYNPSSVFFIKGYLANTNNLSLTTSAHCFQIYSNYCKQHLVLHIPR